MTERPDPSLPNDLPEPGAEPDEPAPRTWMRPRVNSAALVGLATLVLAVGGMVLGYQWSEREGMDRLFEVATERLELYAGGLESELGRTAHLPALVALDQDVQALFADTQTHDTRERAAQQLARMNVHAGALMIFATDLQGRLLASSEGSPERLAGDPRLPRLTLIARELQRRSRGFFATEPPLAGTDFYSASAVRRAGETVGYVVVGVNLAPLEATWTDLGVRSASEKLLVLDDQDVVIMSSVPAWTYRSLDELGQERSAALRATGRYPAAPMASLGLRTRTRQLVGAPVVELGNGAPGDPATLYVAQERAMAPLGLRFMALSDPADVQRNARAAAWGVAAAVGLAGLAVLYLLHRRRALQQLFKARNQLQAARDDLERQVALRTGELQATNDALEQQVRRSRQSEDELIQAGKLAVLGQMTAGIAHELNQPLTALRALAANSVRMIEVGRTEALGSNLRAIGEVAERMGRITSQLKTFARRGGDAPDTVVLAQAVGNARVMLEHRLLADNARCDVALPDELRVRADGTRLEQVLLNLMSNALDAMAGQPQPRLQVAAAQVDGRVLVRVTDQGKGMDDATHARLFEPFFTTKPPGEGLGLGLVISSKIVREFGGSLRAHRLDTGMCFEFDLAPAEGTERDV
jgi:two-component system C4-dicarboxylate transport sensor histidine kinase DctB